MVNSESCKQQKDKAIVWFNGPSRDQFLNIKKQPIEIGCNYILRDRDVHHVVCYDWQMLDKIEKDDAHTYWCRDGMAAQYPGWKEIPAPFQRRPEQSGTLAVTLAVDILKVTDICIVGLDWGISTQSVYDYGAGRNGTKKHTVGQVRILQKLAERADIKIVADKTRDCNLPHISHEEFSGWLI